MGPDMRTYTTESPEVQLNSPNSFFPPSVVIFAAHGNCAAFPEHRSSRPKLGSSTTLLSTLQCKLVHVYALATSLPSRRLRVREPVRQECSPEHVNSLASERTRRTSVSFVAVWTVDAANRRTFYASTRRTLSARVLSEVIVRLSLHTKPALLALWLRFLHRLSDGVTPES